MQKNLQQTPNNYKDFCEFCQILKSNNKQNTIILAQNDQFFAFNDLHDATAEAHVLVCSKEHIESALDVKDSRLLQRMQQFAQKLMKKIYRQRFNQQATKQCFRYGFHLPPWISVFHIHLHCFILPIKNIMFDKIRYGYGNLFKSVQMIIGDIKKSRPKL